MLDVSFFDSVYMSHIGAALAAAFFVVYVKSGFKDKYLISGLVLAFPPVIDYTTTFVGGDLANMVYYYGLAVFYIAIMIAIAFCNSCRLAKWFLLPVTCCVILGFIVTANDVQVIQMDLSWLGF